MSNVAGLWHEEDRFFYDVLHTPEGPVPIQLRSMSGLVPLLACVKIKLRRLSNTAVYFDRFLSRYPQHVSETCNTTFNTRGKCSHSNQKWVQNVTV